MTTFLSSGSTTDLYVCANRVYMPSVGAETNLLHKTKSLKKPKIKPLSRLPSKARYESLVNKGIVKDVSQGIKFSPDVVEDRCLGAMPYDTKYFLETLDSTQIIPPKPKRILSGNQSTRIVNHIPCNVISAVPKLKPLKKKILHKALKLHLDAIEKNDILKEEKVVEKPKEVAFLTEIEKEPDAKSKDCDWDSYLMTRMSENTSRWILENRLEAGVQHDKLSKLVDTYHGVSDGVTDLVPDNISDGAESVIMPLTNIKKTEEKKWKKPNETLLDKVREMQLVLDKPTDPYDDESNATFYRLPSGLRKERKCQERLEAGAINRTAFNIEVKELNAPPTLQLKDFINPKAGSTVLETKNQFQQEILTGLNQIYEPLESGRIYMENKNIYLKDLQRETPRRPQVWYPQRPSEIRKENQDAGKIKIRKLGAQRWNGLPTAINNKMVILELECEFMIGEESGI